MKKDGADVQRPCALFINPAPSSGVLDGTKHPVPPWTFFVYLTPHSRAYQSALSINIMSVEAKFNKAVSIVGSLPKDGPVQPTQDQQLKFYGL